jgi:hypothetical protein
MSVRAANALYSGFQFVIAIALIGWLFVYSYEDHQQGQCFRTYNERIKTTQAREFGLQAKAVEIARLSVRTK